MIRPLFHFILLVLSLSFFSCEEDVNQGSIDELDLAAEEFIEDYFSPDGVWGFIDKSGMIRIEARYHEVWPFNQGLAVAMQNGLWGMINTDGEWFLDPRFRAVYSVSSDLIRVQTLDGKYGFYTLDAQSAFPHQFQDVTDFKDQYAVAYDGRYFGVIDQKGEWIIPAEYDEIDLDSTFPMISRKHGKLTLIPEGSAEVDLREYERVWKGHSGELIALDENGMTVLDLNGNHLLNKNYHDIRQLPESGYLLLSKEQKVYVFDKDLYALPEVIIDAIPANTASLLVSNGSKWALANRQGHAFSDFEFDLIYPFSEGFAPYLQEGLWGYLDEEGNKLSDAQFGLAWNMKEGLARAAFYEGVGFIDTNGQLAIPPEYDDVRDFSEGLAAFHISASE